MQLSEELRSLLSTLHANLWRSSGPLLVIASVRFEGDICVSLVVGSSGVR